MEDDPLAPEERRELATLDLDRAVWDPEYRRYVMGLLNRAERCEAAATAAE